MTWSASGTMNKDTWHDDALFHPLFWLLLETIWQRITGSLLVIYSFL